MVVLAFQRRGATPPPSLPPALFHRTLDTRQLQTAHLPLVFLRVISPALLGIPGGFGEMRGRATGQPAQPRLECTGSPLSFQRRAPCTWVTFEQKDRGS